MASVLAIISKAQFEADFGKSRVGDVLPVHEYKSLHKALDRLSDGGSLFLVTVRPPDEQLWLVGVLDAPKKGKTSWKAAANTRPVRDISAIRDRIKFDNGKGITAKPGALGMSLQTPRALADADVALLLGGKATAAKAATFTREQLQLETWRTLSKAERDNVVRAIASAKGLKVGSHTDGNGQARAIFKHPSGVELALIPGGRFKMGLNDEEQARLLAFLRDEDDQTGAIELLENPDPLRPVHEVDVAPFLLATVPSAVDFDADELKGVVRSLKRDGLRLPSEAEWEYACRGGYDGAFAHGDEIPSSTQPEPNPFGVYAMGSSMDVCADGYHPSYAGAPTTSEPWKGKGHVTRGGAEPLCWDGPTVWMLALAAARSPFDPDDVCVSARPALSLFDDYARETPVCMLEAPRAYRAKAKPAAAAAAKAKPAPAPAHAPRVQLVAKPSGEPEGKLFRRVLEEPASHEARIAFAQTAFARGDSRGEYLLAVEAGDERRAAELMAQHLTEWVDPVRKALTSGLRYAKFKDGFVDELELNKLDVPMLDTVGELTPIRALEFTQETNVRGLGELLARHHVAALNVWEPDVEILCEMLSTPGVALQSLSLPALGSEALERVLRTPGVAKLDKLHYWAKEALAPAAANAIAALPISDLFIGGAIAGGLAGIASMTTLRSLTIRSDGPLDANAAAPLTKLASRVVALSVAEGIPAKIVAALIAAQPTLERVRLPTLNKSELAPIVSALRDPHEIEFQLSRDYQPLGADGVKLLANAGWMNLVKLDVSSAAIGDDGAKVIGAWDGPLRYLNLANNGITARGAEALAKGKGLRSLRAFNIWMNPIGSGGANALAAAGFAGELRELSLFSNRIGGPGLRALLGATTQLEKLKLGSENSYRDEGVKLATAGALPRLRDFDFEEVSTEAIEAWTKSDHAATVERLFIGNSTLSRAAAESIAALPRLAVMRHNFVMPAATGALTPIFDRWWGSLSV